MGLHPAFVGPADSHCARSRRTIANLLLINLNDWNHTPAAAGDKGFAQSGQIV